MYSSILVPLDGSAFGERALPVALALARRSGARIELVHAHERYVYASGAPMFDARLDEEFSAEMRKSLESLAERLRRKTGLTLTTTFLEGRVTRTLREYIAESGAHLVVMTTHGHGGLSRAWLGSVADQVVRHSTRPVLLVRPGAAAAASAADEPLFRRIVVPLDGSDAAEAALDHAVMLGTPGDTEYALVQVVVPRPILAHAAPYPGGVPVADRGELERRRAEAREYLDRVRADFEANGFAAKAEVIVHRQIARGILEYARGYDGDLIALATRGRGGMSRLLLGSVADKVLRGATTPLLMYHPPRVELAERDTRPGAVAASPHPPPAAPTAA